MNIVILNGSPRAKGNTYEMCKAFMDGAKQGGHEVEYIHVSELNISPCRSCFYCKGEGGGKCILNDDMGPLLEKLEAADLMVLASPVYYFSLSAQLQTVIDRFFVKGKPSIKKMMLLLSSGSDNVYSACYSQFKQMTEYIGAEDLGVFTAHGEQNRTPELINRIYNFAMKNLK